MKSIYKYMFSIPIGCMLLGFQSCSDDKTEGESNPQPVILKAEVYTAGNETGTVWNSGQSLGVYMLKNGTREIAGEHANLKFLADNRGSTGYLVPADNVPVYYPEDGTKVDFRVYYPYDEKIKTRSQDLHQTEVVITDKTQADALLYSDNSQGNDGSGRPTVQLRSMLSAVKLDMHCDMEEAATITATIRNTAIRAVFDVIEGKFVKRPLEEGSSLQLTATRKTSTSGDIFTLQATLLSGVMEEGAEIEIEVKDKAGKVITSYQPAKLRKVLDLGKDNVAEENTQYEIDGQLNAGSENITTQMAAKTQIVILKWNGNDDSAIGGIARPERKQK